jgi:diaminohydroxyphosphoribosylaminopyrimidine deaminase/5-amino-6-(5-phosphoribosylamino)uracil reductase
VVATADPFPKVNGRGIDELRRAGVRVESGLLQREAQRQNAPYFKRVQTGRPWVIAKWAMSLDGKLSTSRRESRWVSGSEAQQFVHSLRGRVDAVIVGSRTAMLDDPLLTARPPGPRIATRIVFDSSLQLSPQSRLAQTARDAPVLLISRRPTADRRSGLEQLGCEVFDVSSESRVEAVDEVLCELARRGMTNVLVEGGGELLGSFFDARQIDEVVAFVAPKLIGGQHAVTAIGGRGIERIDRSVQFCEGEWSPVGSDMCWRGRVRWEAES